MNDGVTLIELMVCLLLTSFLMLMLCSLNHVAAWSYSDISSEWYCMQSIRCAFLQLDRDLAQCGCLMPGELEIAVEPDNLFIAGVPVTGSNGGLEIGDAVPPYYALVETVGGKNLMLDETDIDGNGQDDFWAGLAVITDSGPAVIEGSYSRGELNLPVGEEGGIVAGDRVVPAIHYQLRADGLYRDGQLLAEAISGFDLQLQGGRLDIGLKATDKSLVREVGFSYELP